MQKKRIPSTAEELEGSSKEFFVSVREESDRGCVLVAAAFLDEALEAILRSHMSQETHVVRDIVGRLFRPDGPLGTFSAKISLCRALQLIDQQDYEDLDRIRGLRNHFAHSHNTAAFAEQHVKDLAAGFSIFGDIHWVDKDGGDGVLPARKRFVFAASWLAGSLHNRVK
jgi:DNA-binding MltR family transcriptional regulator